MGGENEINAGAETDRQAPRGTSESGWRRLRKSLASRGVRTTLEGLAAKVHDRWFDFRNGTDTAGTIELDALQIPSENKSRGVNYMPTHASAFLALMDSLTLPADSVLVDFGCGKGKVLLLASPYRFKRIVGVEFAPELCAVAKRNVALFKKRRAIATDIAVVEGDAADYAIADDENVFFLFNPFDEVVLGRVVRNIEASDGRRPRRIWIVYNHPVCLGVIRRSGRWLEAGSYAHGSSTFGIYTNGAGEAAERPLVRVT